MRIVQRYTYIVCALLSTSPPSPPSPLPSPPSLPPLPSLLLHAGICRPLSDSSGCDTGHWRCYHGLLRDTDPHSQVWSNPLLPFVGVLYFIILCANTHTHTHTHTYAHTHTHTHAHTHTHTQGSLHSQAISFLPPTSWKNI